MQDNVLCPSPVQDFNFDLLLTITPIGYEYIHNFKFVHYTQKFTYVEFTKIFTDIKIQFSNPNVSEQT